MMSGPKQSFLFEMIDAKITVAQKFNQGVWHWLTR